MLKSHHMISMKFFRVFIPAALIISLVCGASYVAIQQVLRQEGNDPQIQLSEDLATALAAGQPIDGLQQAAAESIDLTRSLAPFFMVFDDAGKNLISSGKLDGAAPVLPQSVLDATKASGQNRITWEPKAGVRIAAVIVHYQDKASGYVLIGRSLRETEQREAALAYPFLMAWGLSLFIALIASLLSCGKKERQTAPQA